MFRRTDCHVSARANEVAPSMWEGSSLHYNAKTRKLISGAQGRVYISTDKKGQRLKPRICIRGPEIFEARDLGYAQLPAHEVFPFYELRSAAEDLTGSLDTAARNAKCDYEMRKRIRAQLDTLVHWDVRHVVLSAFGCGAFLHSATAVAHAYADLLTEYASHFDVVAFGIYYAGWGENNFAEFAAVFRSHPTLCACFPGCTPAAFAPEPEPEPEPDPEPASESEYEYEDETDLDELDEDWAAGYNHAAGRAAPAGLPPVDSGDYDYDCDYRYDDEDEAQPDSQGSLAATLDEAVYM